jgi:hypothetical protein
MRQGKEFSECLRKKMGMTESLVHKSRTTEKHVKGTVS